MKLFLFSAEKIIYITTDGSFSMEIKEYQSLCPECEFGYMNIRLINASGMEIILTSYGAGIRSLRIPDKKGTPKEVVFTPENEKMYRLVYHGKTIGRTSGRIENATFTIDDKTAQLDKNNFSRDNLHGGKSGLNFRVFGYEILKNSDYCDVRFSYLSPDGEGGYFGNVLIEVTYRIYERKSRVQIIYRGKSDCRTLLNLTNHSYFNLSGDLFSPIQKQKLYINASAYGELNERLIAEKIVPVDETMSFKTPHSIGEHIEDEALHRFTNGYDHPYFLDDIGVEHLAAFLKSDDSGLKMEVRTSYPCIVFYSNGQGLKNFVLDGVDYSLFSACCLECQYHPDGIHRSVDNCGIFDENHPYRETIDLTFIAE